MAPLSMSIVLSVMLAPGFAVAQDATPKARAPDTVVTALELESAVQHMDPAPVADAPLRVFSIGDEYNVGISVVGWLVAVWLGHILATRINRESLVTSWRNAFSVAWHCSVTQPVIIHRNLRCRLPSGPVKTDPSMR